MKVTFAQFHIEHKKKMYGVRYTIQDVEQNVSRFTIQVINAQQETLGNFSGSGRQAVSPWNAKEILKKVLEEKGLYKRRERKPKREGEQ